MNRLRKQWLDDLSGWTMPPPRARAAGEVDPVRVFDSAEAAIVCLAKLFERQQAV